MQRHDRGEKREEREKAKEKDGERGRKIKREREITHGKALHLINMQYQIVEQRLSIS